MRHLLFGVVLAFASPAQAADLAVKERAPIWLALHLPARQFASASASEIVEVADGAIRRTTDFKVKLVPEPIVDACAAQGGGAVACFVRALKGESRFLLMVSTIDETHLVSLLVDLEEAERIVRESSGTEEETDKQVSAKAILSATLPTELRSPPELDSYFVEFLGGELARLFQQAGARTLGGVELVIPSGPGAEISVDGVRFPAKAGTVTIRDVPAGRHVLRIEQDGYTPWESSIDVKPLEMVHVTATLQSTSIVVNRAVRQATFYGGFVTIATGAALGIASLFDDSPVCIGEDCPRSYIRTSLLPIGYSLVGMGAAWTLGAWLGDEDAFPWIELLAGVVVFGVSYGVTWAVDGRCREDCFNLTGR